MFKTRLSICIAIVSTGISVNAAELTLSQALREALEHNPAYQATQSDVRFAKSELDSAWAGFLPTASANAAYGRNWLDAHQNSNGAVTNLSGAQYNSTTAGVNADWTLFQGFSGPLGRKRLNLQLSEARDLEGESREDLVSNVVLAYADLTRQTRLYRAQDTSAAISAERLVILESSLKAGAASRSDWLTARVDLDADQAALIRQKAVLQSARVVLGHALGRNQPVMEDVDTVVSAPNVPGLDTLLSGLPNYRPDLKVAETNVDLASVTAEQRATIWLPKIDALAGYNYSLTNSPENVLQTRTVGPNVGLQFNFNLFTGEFPWQAYHRARIGLTSATLREQDALTAAQTEVLQDNESFQSADSASALEHEALGYAQENLGLTFTRWKSGSLAYIDARQAQVQYLQAFTLEENAAFDALTARLNLLRDAGRLELMMDSSSTPE